jgi:hypothetical protein
MKLVILVLFLAGPIYALKCWQYTDLCRRDCKSRNYKYATANCKVPYCDCANTTAWQCYPGESLIIGRKGPKAVRDVRIGDEILVRLSNGTDAFRLVYAFSSHRPDEYATFVRLSTPSHSVLVSPDHLVPSEGHMLSADALMTNNTVFTVTGKERVTTTELVMARGLFNMHAWDSDGIFVDGILVSEFTESSAWLTKVPAGIGVREGIVYAAARPLSLMLHKTKDTY